MSLNTTELIFLLNMSLGNCGLPSQRDSNKKLYYSLRCQLQQAVEKTADNDLRCHNAKETSL